MQRGEVVAERFRVEARAGAGATGTVYRAVDEGGALVALKVFEPFTREEERKRFEREVELLESLSHAGIVRYVGHGITGRGRPYLAMEWLGGITLSELLVSTPRLPLDDTLTLGRRISAALAVAHGCGVIHRDLKPSNLFLVGGRIDQVKILDFGLARPVDATLLTLTGALLGTPGFMAPEQARGMRGIDERTDVFALGCIMFRCLTGRPPFEGDQLLAVLAKILLEEVPPVRELAPEVPLELEALVGSMLDKDPDGRPADAAAVAAALAEIGRTPGPKSAPPPAPITARERRLISAFLAGALPGGCSSPELDGRFGEAADTFGGRLELLADGSRLIFFAGSTDVGDLATRAARCALSLRPCLGDCPGALASGRAVLSGRLPIGEVIDRAALALSAGRPGQVVLDEATAALLDARFAVRREEERLVLLGEQGEADAARTLMGKSAPIVGREPELALLENFYAECSGDSAARAVIVTAPPGTGKTRLRQELVRRLLRRDPELEVWVGAGDSLGAGSPFAVLAGALRRAAAILEGEPPDVQREKLFARVARQLSPERARRVVPPLGEVLGVQFSPDAGAAPLSDRLAHRDAVREAWLEWLGAELTDHPLLIVLEDLHWGDRPTLDFVGEALRRLEDAPLMVVALARPELEERFPGLWRESDPHVLRLAGLRRRAAARLVRALLGAGAGGGTVDRIVERAGGNAFFLEELIRASAEGRPEVLPESVLLILQSRLDALDERARRLLRAASVFGRSFWAGGVAALTGDGLREVQAQMGALEDRELIRGKPVSSLPGEREYTFRHDLIQETAYATLPDADRARGHLLAGLWLEERGVSDAVALAEHFARGDERERAARWFVRAAEQALAGNDFESVLERARRGLDCAVEELEGDFLLLVAEAESWRGEVTRAAEAAGRAVAAFPRGSVRWFRAMDELFYALGRVGPAREQESGAVLEEMMQVEPAPEARSEALHALARAAIMLVRFGRGALARDLLERISSLAGSLEQPPTTVAARVHAVRSLLAREAGDAELCLLAHEEGDQLLVSLGDRRTLLLHRLSWGGCLAELGEQEAAARMLKENLEDAEAQGISAVTVILRWAYAAVCLQLNRLEEARQLVSAHAEAARARGETHLEGRFQMVLGRALLAEGDAASAVGALERAAEVAGAGEVAAEAHGWLARARAAAGDSAGALAAARLAKAMLRPTYGFAAGESAVRLAEVEALEAAGEREAAAAALAEAAASLRARAARLPERFRKNFLYRVRENAETLARAGAQGDPVTDTSGEPVV